jgi:hypothetical protein
LSYVSIALSSKNAKYIIMLFESANRGKVIISVELIDGRISSHIQRKGIAKEDKYAIASVLGTYISMCMEAGKDPKKILEDNLQHLGEIISSQREDET